VEKTNQTNKEATIQTIVFMCPRVKRSRIVLLDPAAGGERGRLEELKYHLRKYTAMEIAPGGLRRIGGGRSGIVMLETPLAVADEVIE
jgi:hypothetical protein